MQRNPLCDFIEMVASGATTSQQQQPPPPPLDYAALLCSAFPQHYNVNSSTQSEVVESVMPLPSEKTERPESPISVTDSLPKETENGCLKRSAAIQELLLSKRARLSKSIRITTPPDSVSNDTPTSVTPMPSDVDIKLNPMTEPLEIIVKTEPTNSEDTESTSGSHTCTEASTPPPSSSSINGMSVLIAMQEKFLEYQRTLAMKDVLKNELSVPIPQTVVPNDFVFTQVPSRLTLLSQVVKYNMTVGELRRRIAGPEAFNFSLLGALLRRAKLPTKSNQLFAELETIGIIIPRGRRRAAINLFSALTEEETVKLARDFAELTEREMPSKKLALKVSRDVCISRVSVVGTQHLLALAFQRRRQLELVRKSILEFIAVLRLDRSPIREYNPNPLLPESIQSHLTNFSTLTHGFGSPGILVAMNAFLTYVDAQIESIPVIYSNF